MPQSSNVLSFVPMTNSESGPRKTSGPTKPEFFGVEDESVLRKIAEAALSATGADGAALALRRNGAVVCVARAGGMAPPLGAQLDDTSGMSGACLREGHALRCDDTETDDRVDAEACRDLGLRSLVVAPVKDSERVIGILEVFSPSASAFTERHVEVLRQLAELVSVETSVEPSEVESLLVTKSPPESTVTNVLPQPRLLPTKPPEALLVEETVALAATTVAIAVPAAVSPARATEEAQKRVTSATPLPADVNISAYMAAHEKAQTQGRPRVPNIVLVGLATVIFAAFVGWYFRHWVPSNSPAQNTATIAVTSPPAVVPGAVSAAASDSTPEAERSGATGANRPNTKPDHDGLIQAAKRERIATDTSHEVTKPLQVVTNSPPAEAAAEDLPGLAALRGEAKANDTVGGLLNTPAVLPQKAPPISQGVEGGELESKVGAIYPPQARSASQQGAVVLEALVGEDGSVRDIKIVSGPPLLRQAAVDAVRRWKYKPFRLNGRPIAAETRISVEFKLQ